MTIDLYHGSNKIIKNPTPDGGRIHNDYGQGFYCTRHIELAKEWAVSEDHDGYVNHYELNLNGLKILNLNNGSYSILHWITLLLQNRVFDRPTTVAQNGFDYLTKKYSINTNDYDVIVGYRADDSYYSFARAFLSNTISIEQLEKSMHLGELGEQYFIKSKKAFSQLSYGDCSCVLQEDYYPKKLTRNENARKEYLSLLADITTGTYLIDLIRKEH